MRRWPPDEASLAAVVVEYLTVDQWDVYQEVQLSLDDIVADIVAVRGPVTMVVEAKTALTWRLLEQAERWRGRANRIAIATPNSGHSTFVHGCLARSGIGWLAVPEPITGQQPMWYADPPLHRIRPAWCIRKALRPEHKTWGAAGNAASERYTPFKKTCRAVLEAVLSRPGVTVKEMMGMIEHHYSSDATARSSIAQWARAGKIPGVTVRAEGGTLRLFPEST